MKIGIIVYSQTGNTLSVVKKLKEKMTFSDVTIHEIKAKRDMKTSNIFKINEYPDVGKYDKIIIASYVEAFMLCPVMVEYLKKISSLNNKEVYGIITHHFPYAWMGGNNAGNMMNKLVTTKDGNYIKSYIINWSRKDRSKQIDLLIDSIINKINVK